MNQHIYTRNQWMLMLKFSVWWPLEYPDNRKFKIFREQWTWYVDAYESWKHPVYYSRNICYLTQSGRVKCDLFGTENSVHVNLYPLNNTAEEAMLSQQVVVVDSRDLWYESLGQKNVEGITSRIKKKSVTGLEVTSEASPMSIYESCVRGKFRRV